MAFVRHAALDVTVFTLGATGTFIDDLENATLAIEVKDEEASGIKDQWEYPWATKSRWQIEADVFANTIAKIMPLVGSSVSLTFTSGANAYTGTVLVTMGNHIANRGSVQKQRCVLKGQGALTIA